MIVNGLTLVGALGASMVAALLLAYVSPDRPRARAERLRDARLARARSMARHPSAWPGRGVTTADRGGYPPRLRVIDGREDDVA